MNDTNGAADVRRARVALVDPTPQRPEVLLAGVPQALARALTARLPQLRTRAEPTGDGALRRLAERTWSALVVHAELPDMRPIELLAQLSERADAARMPVLYCAAADAGASEQTLSRLGVTIVLSGATDADRLADAVRRATAAGPPMPPPPQPGADLASEIAALWERFKGVTMQRLDTVDGAIVALLEGRLVEEQRRSAEREAHKLSGAVGTFGFAEGSRLAREIEVVLQGPLGPAETLRLSDLAVALRRELEQSPRRPAREAAEPAALEGGAARPEAGPEPAATAMAPAAARLLFVIIEDADACERIVLEAEGRGHRVRAARDAEEARAALSVEAPDVVVLDLPFGGTIDRGLALLSEITRRAPAARVVVLSERAGFEERLEVARRGGRSFLQKPVAPTRIADAVQDMLGGADGTARRVLAVDDDPQTLAALRAVLRPPGLELITLEEPLEFWATLERTRPDLLILDVDMPQLSGPELCTVIRNDPRWAALPVLFLTATTDAAEIHALFAAGADDYVSKPFAGPELRTRIENRLERQRLQRALAELDPLTGLANRGKTFESLTRLAHLAARQRQPLSIGLIDVDRFRDLNRVYGPTMADAVLRSLARVLRDACRLDEIVGRWGNEEFVVGLFGVQRDEAVVRLRDALERFRAVDIGGDDGQVASATFSAGIATFPQDGSDIAALSAAAEDILAVAKAEGRGMVLPAGWTPDRTREPEKVDVVLIEDDVALAGLLAHTLETRGHTTKRISDGEEAIEALCGPLPRVEARVVLLDVDLPGRDGFQVLQALARDRVTDRSRVVMLTVRATEPEVLKALELGAFDHVSKPFSVQILMQRIRRALGG